MGGWPVAACRAAGSPAVGSAAAGSGGGDVGGGGSVGLVGSGVGRRRGGVGLRVVVVRFGSVVVVVFRGERSMVVLGAGGSVVVVGVVVVVVVGSSGSVSGDCRSRGGAVVVVVFSASGWVVGVGWSFEQLGQVAGVAGLDAEVGVQRGEPEVGLLLVAVDGHDVALAGEPEHPAVGVEAARDRMAAIGSAAPRQDPLRALLRGRDDVAVPDRQVDDVGVGCARCARRLPSNSVTVRPSAEAHTAAGCDHDRRQDVAAGRDACGCPLRRPARSPRARRRRRRRRPPGGGRSRRSTPWVSTSDPSGPVTRTATRSFP